MTSADARDDRGGRWSFAIAMLALMSILLFYAMVVVERRMVPWVR